MEMHAYDMHLAVPFIRYALTVPLSHYTNYYTCTSICQRVYMSTGRRNFLIASDVQNVRAADHTEDIERQIPVVVTGFTV